MATLLVDSKTNMLDTRTNTDAARLVLAVGSRAGREAPLQYGYYMIGRHCECQIRPKSRSVSRRHCLLYQDDTGLQVMDLNSTAGTRVNDLRIRPKIWTSLRHGDMLRCGKVAFRVDLGGTTSAGHRSSSSSASGGGPADSMPVGQAWHDVDIAGFLETQDDADRELRYSHIRAANESESESSDGVLDDLQTTIEMDTDLDLFDDAFSDPQPNSVNREVTLENGQRSRNDSVESRAASRSGVMTNQPKSSEPDSKADRVPKPARKRSSSSVARRFSIGIPADAERWKLVGLTILLLLVLGAVGFSAYRFYSGPSVRVLQSID